MQKITYFYFARFIKAVPIMGPGFLQPIFFQASFHRVLGKGLCGTYAPWISESPDEKSERVKMDVNDFFAL